MSVFIIRFICVKINHMEFELTPEIVDEVIFSMEDQTGHFLFDSVESRCVPDTGGSSRSGNSVFEDGDDRYYAIPVWDSISGFRMMDRFVAQLRNPVVREDLRLALSSGHGVFRNFKNILREHPEIERMWYRFKQREMRAIVLEWYNGLRDFWGLERIGMEPEETDEIVSQDFSFRFLGAEDTGSYTDFLESARQEVYSELPPGLGDALEVLYMRLFDSGCPDRHTVVLVEDLEDEPVAIAVSAPLPDSGSLCAQISALYVLPSFRGMGIGKELLSRLVAHWAGRGYRWLVCAVSPVPAAFFPALHRAGFVDKGHISVLDLSENFCP